MIEEIKPPEKIGEWSIIEIEKALSRPLPESLLGILEKKNRKTGKTVQLPFIPWHTANRILSKYAPGWSGKVTSIQQIGNELILAYRLEIPTSEGVIVRESTGSESLDCGSYGETAANAESQAFRRCAAKFGLGLYLYNKKNGAVAN